MNLGPLPHAAPRGLALLVGRSGALERVREQIARVARAPRTTVLVGGESGVGKELVARAIHEESARAAGPFVALNSAALAEGLLEAELFGYEPGAFTGGASKGREGLIRAAEGGTLFLDEIGELAPSLQAKLLRVLQERRYRRVGANQEQTMDVRIVASTNRDLARAIADGTFREDLFYRLNVMSIVVPPLRERRDDVLVLAGHFLARAALELERVFAGFTPDAQAALAAHDWPGNVRELQNTIERAALLSLDEWIGLEDLELAPSDRPEPAPALPARAAEALPLGDRSLRGLEEALIRRVLQDERGNKRRAAQVLGINRATLYNKLKTYCIEP